MFDPLIETFPMSSITMFSWGEMKSWIINISWLKRHIIYGYEKVMIMFITWENQDFSQESVAKN